MAPMRAMTVGAEGKVGTGERGNSKTELSISSLKHCVESEYFHILINKMTISTKSEVTVETLT